MIYAISAQTHPFYTDGRFMSYFTSNKISRVLVIAEHHTKGGVYAMQKLKNTALGIAESSIEFVHGDYTLFDRIGNNLSEFDGLYITGGLTDHLQIYLHTYNLYPSIIDLIKNPHKIYVGASAGAIMLGKIFHTESELDAIHISRLSHEGFGIFPHILFEVHYNESGNTAYLDARSAQTLYQNSELTQALLLDTTCCLRFSNAYSDTYECLSGTVKTILQSTTTTATPL